jgi:hypothetical protein
VSRLLVLSILSSIYLCLGSFHWESRLRAQFGKRIRRILEKGSKNYPWNVQSLLEKVKKGTIRKKMARKGDVRKKVLEKEGKKKNFWISILCP